MMILLRRESNNDLEMAKRPESTLAVHSKVERTAGEYQEDDENWSNVTES